MTSRILSAALLLQALLLASTATAAHLPQGVADTLNFALNLECLEAQFYSCAVFGKRPYSLIKSILLNAVVFHHWMSLITDLVVDVIPRYPLLLS
jgi:Ferritin-like domain